MFQRLVAVIPQQVSAARLLVHRSSAHAHARTDWLWATDWLQCLRKQCRAGQRERMAIHVEALAFCALLQASWVCATYRKGKGNSSYSTRTPQQQSYSF